MVFWVVLLFYFLPTWSSSKLEYIVSWICTILWLCLYNVRAIKRLPIKISFRFSRGVVHLTCYWLLCNSVKRLNTALLWLPVSEGNTWKYEHPSSDGISCGPKVWPLSICYSFTCRILLKIIYNIYIFKQCGTLKFSIIIFYTIFRL